ncbi:MAG: hypothetical protein LBC62_09765 [Treponema sp.]|nr:hypothetical protein [Treponema sp.]
MIFTVKYTLSDTVLPLCFDTVEAVNRKFFIINFYVSLGLSLTGNGFRNPGLSQAAVIFLCLVCLAVFVNLARYLK